MNSASKITFPDTPKARRHVSPLAIGIWGMVVLFVIYQFVLRVSLGVMAPSLMERFVIDATQFSLLGSLFYFGYASMQIPVGILLDRFGPLRIVPIFVLLCVAGFCLFTFSNNWALALFGRFITGIGSAGAFISSLKVTHLLFPERLFKFLVGLTSSLGLLGAICGGLIGILLTIYSLSDVLQGLSGLGIVFLFAILSLFYQKKSKALLKSQETPMEETEQSILAGLKVIFKKPSLLILIFCTALMTMALYTFADSWGPSFLMQYHHLSMDQASFSIFLIYIGMTIGATLLSFIGERFNITQLIVATSGFITAVILFGFLAISHIPYYSILYCMFIFGMCASLQILVFGLILSQIPKRFGGIITGLTNMTIMLLGSGSISLAGFLMDFSNDKIIQNGTPIYGQSAYTLSFGCIAILVLIGAIGFSIVSITGHFKQKKSHG